MVYRSSREVQAGDRDVGVSSMCIVFKARGLGEITKGLSVDTKEKRSKSEALQCVEVGKRIDRPRRLRKDNQRG